MYDMEQQNSTDVKAEHRGSRYLLFDSAHSYGSPKQCHEVVDLLRADHDTQENLEEALRAVRRSPCLSLLSCETNLTQAISMRKSRAKGEERRALVGYDLAKVARGGEGGARGEQHFAATEQSL